jgi:hypothetical protein
MREGGQVRGEGWLILFRSLRQEQVQHPSPDYDKKIMIIVMRVVLRFERVARYVGRDGSSSSVPSDRNMFSIPRLVKRGK